MPEFATMQALAKSLDAKRFAARNPHLFLLKRGAAGHRSLRINYETAILRPSEEPPPATLEETELLVRVSKRPGNPFPDRISVGRANNCDIVLRFAFVSKLHAHFVAEKNGSFGLVDNNSSNGTLHNGVRLQPGKLTRVAPGDTIAFGPMRLELMNAAMLHSVLLELDDDEIE